VWIQDFLLSTDLILRTEDTQSLPKGGDLLRLKCQSDMRVGMLSLNQSFI